MALTERRRKLLATDRWAALEPLIERWFVAPLSDRDGNSPSEIERVALSLRASLPAAVAEFFELLGERFAHLDGWKLLLHDIEIDPRFDHRCVRVVITNHGVSSVFVPLDAGDDPMCSWEGKKPLVDRFSRNLLAMLLHDTLATAWGGGTAMLGRLGSNVRGASHYEVAASDIDRLRSVYGALDHVLCLYGTEPFRGDSSTIIRITHRDTSEVGIEWMTATDAAFDALAAVFPEAATYVPP